MRTICGLITVNKPSGKQGMKVSRLAGGLLGTAGLLASYPAYKLGAFKPITNAVKRKLGMAPKKPGQPANTVPPAGAVPPPVANATGKQPSANVAGKSPVGSVTGPQSVGSPALNQTLIQGNPLAKTAMMPNATQMGIPAQPPVVVQPAGPVDQTTPTVATPVNNIGGLVKRG